ncbi:MAG: DNA polymerase-2 [Oleispira sp.]|jgi:DNA polymerase-2
MSLMSASKQKGFLLTSRWYEGKENTELEFWFASDAGPLCALIEQPSVCFIPLDEQDKAQKLARAEGIPLTCREVQLCSFSLKPLIACYLRQSDIYRFNYLLSDWDIKVWEYDLRPTDRYLMERFVRGGAEIEGQWQSCDGYLLCQQGRIKPSQAAVESAALTILSVDIETTFPKEGKHDRLFSIACHGEAIINGQRETVNHIWMVGAEISPAAKYCEYVADEVVLLKRFFSEMQRLDPDVIIGWNFIQFDMDFIQRKCDELGLPFTLGRNQQEVSWRHDQSNTNRSYVHVPGRCIIDGIEMLRQAQYQFDSFALNSVAEELLDRHKLISGEVKIYEGYDHEIEYLFDHDKPALAAYNLEDCILVADIFHHTELMDFAIQRSSLTGLLLDRMGGSVAAFENLYLPLLHRNGYVAPNYGEGYSDIKSPGGFVMDSRPGLYDSILVLDFKSLYPSIMRTFKIDPMGLIEGLKVGQDPRQAQQKSQTIAGFNGGYFDREKHCLPDLITMLGEQRDQAKKVNNHHLAQAIKIIMSSFYGVLGSDGCRFFDMRLSSSITQRSHEIIQRSARWIESQGFDVIYGDTDSVFVWLKEKHTQQQADDMGKQLSNALNSWWQETIQQEHQLESLLEIEYETHYQRFFMPSIRGAETGSKKRYAGTVQKTLATGEITTETVFKGLEAVRSDWTPLAREFQRQLFQRIFSQQSFQQWMKDEIAELMAGKKSQQLIYRKRLRQPLSEYQRNIPPHAKAAAVLELWRKQQGLPLLYQHRGGWIQYLMTTSGPQPIEVFNHAQGALQIDYQHYLEKQLAPVCDGLLQLYDTSFAEICGQQLSLF